MSDIGPQEESQFESMPTPAPDAADFSWHENCYPDQPVLTENDTSNVTSFPMNPAAAERLVGKWQGEIDALPSAKRLAENYLIAGILGNIVTVIGIDVLHRRGHISNMNELLVSISETAFIGSVGLLHVLARRVNNRAIISRNQQLINGMYTPVQNTPDQSSTDQQQ